jgi:hypothetical protein
MSCRLLTTRLRPISRSSRAWPPPALRTVRGFNVAHASCSGIDWIAVSDVSADVLSPFVQRLARADAAPWPASPHSEPLTSAPGSRPLHGAMGKTTR